VSGVCGTGPKSRELTPVIKKRTADEWLAWSFTKQITQQLRKYYGAQMTEELPPRLRAVLKKLLEEEKASEEETLAKTANESGLFMASVDEKEESAIQEQWNNSTHVNNAAHSVFKIQETIVVDDRRTLEDLTREMLRPMLKVWLDENLPTLVQRLVRAEIGRVSKSPSHTSAASPEKPD
jgi:cell pole-organizing protein PopZ